MKVVASSETELASTAHINYYFIFGA